MSTREELRARQVPRRVGLAILKLVAAAEGLLAPSGVANVLRGVRGSDAARAHPHLTESPLFGSVRDLGYADLVTDIQAMHAKGFLASAADSIRLILDASGRRIVAAGGHPAPSARSPDTS